MKAGTVLDLKIKKIGSRPYGKEISRCPKCGEKGEKSKYKDGSEMYVHIKVFRGWFFDVKENCFITNK